MAKRPQRAKPILSRNEFLLVRLCLVLAFAILLFLAWTSLQSGGIPGCGPESDCERVLSSRWGYVFGLPASLVALPVYAGLFILLFQRTIAWKAVMPLAAAVLFAAIWFTSVQMFILKAFCKYCMTAHIAGSIAALVLLRRNPLNARQAGVSVAAGAAASVLLVIAQLTSKAPAPVLVQTSAANSSAPSAPASDPTFTIVNGQFTLNLNQVPLAGSVRAPKKVVKLFDYTCRHCRDLHHALNLFQNNHPNQLAIVMLPMPLDSACNPLFTRTQPSHINACEYARLGLAVHYAKAEKFEEFSDWLFAEEKPPLLERARMHAEQLVGASALHETLANPVVDQRLAENIRIYDANRQLTRNSRMPQMIFEHASSIGGVVNYAQLEQIMAESLGIGRAGPGPAGGVTSR